MAGKKVQTTLVIRGESGNAVRHLRLAQDEVDRLTNKQNRASMAAGQMAGKTRDLTNAAGKYAALIGGALAVASGKMIADQMGVIDNLGKMSDAMGIATDKVAGYQHAANIAGVSNEGLIKSVQKMSKNFGEASIGLGQSVYWLEEMGLSSEKFFGQTPDQQFNQVADSIAGMESAQQRAAAAQAIFGREGGKMVNMLKGGSAGLQELAQEAINAGTALSRVEVAKVEQANDSIARAKLTATGFAQQVTIGVAPIIEDLATKFFNVGQEAGGMGETATGAINYVLDGIGVFANGIYGLQVAFKGLSTISAKAWSYILEGMVRVDESVTKFLNKLPTWMGGGSYKESQAMKEASAVMSGVFETMQADLDAMITAGLPSERIKEYVAEVQRASTETAEATAEGVAVMNDQVQTNFDTLKEKAKKSADFTVNVWNEATGAIEGQFNATFEKVFGQMGGYANSISGSIVRRLGNVSRFRRRGGGWFRRGCWRRF